MFDFVDAYRAYRRGKSEQNTLPDVISSWGGQVLESRRISRLVKSPFQGYRAYANLHEFRTNHGARRGYWFARTSSDDMPPEWAWMDLDGYTTLPVAMVGASVVSETKVVGMLEDSILVGGLIVGGVAATLIVVILLS